MILKSQGYEIFQGLYVPAYYYVYTAHRDWPTDNIRRCILDFRTRPIIYYITIYIVYDIVFLFNSIRKIFHSGFHLMIQSIIINVYNFINIDKLYMYLFYPLPLHTVPNLQQNSNFNI